MSLDTLPAIEANPSAGAPRTAVADADGIDPAPAPLDLDAARAELDGAGARDVVAWAADRFGSGLVVSTSFGIHSAAMLHLATSVVPRIPVVWVDTGYLPAETYRFAEDLERRLRLNLHVVQSPISPARMEAVHGRLWQTGDPAVLDRYHRMRKVEPMQRALRERGATAWLAGLRADQTDFRRSLSVIEAQRGIFKLSPILGWSTRDVHRYLVEHGLPYHPLFDQGYATVGDWHSSRPVTADDAHERDTRFGGIRQECGLHLSEDEDQSLQSSNL